MIRINLAPSKRKAPARTVAGPTTSAVGAQWWLGLMVIGWVGFGAVAWWLLKVEEDTTQQLRQNVSQTNKKIEAIKSEIDEEGLKTREAQVEQMEVAIKKLNAKRRTPVYVMYELAMILTDAKDGGGPDVDQEKYRRHLRDDPQNEINERWDPTGLWFNGIDENAGMLSISGGARDAADLTEFTRRLRASARFGELSNPVFERVGGRQDAARILNWKLSVQVRQWD